jgi:hypothetical protein
MDEETEAGHIHLVGIGSKLLTRPALDFLSFKFSHYSLVLDRNFS